MVREQEIFMYRYRLIQITCALLLVLPVISGCTSDNTKAPTTDSGPVVNRAPYWCQLVSRESLSKVTGVSQKFTQVQEIDAQQPYSECEVRSQSQEPLIVELAVDGRAEFLANDEFKRPRSRIPLPKVLGRAGYAPLAGNSAYTVFAEFRCGGRSTWIAVTVRPIARGRTAAKDLPELLKIAESRYADLAQCVISDRPPLPSAS